ncbi:UspA [Macleaya cordata]|uniref:UspA n=1 Tax=Macleaya cordata TaxID=56857 RepID=A0A200RAM6_MACCD|nr:UspA [Macleaya cordata]
MKKIVVVVEEVEAARTALQWALHNLLSYGDLIILLHVFPHTRSSSSSSSSSSTRANNKKRVLRLKGFELALSFKDLCDTILNAKVHIIVKEGDQDGITIASMVREIEASALVVGLHDKSFLYK